MTTGPAPATPAASRPRAASAGGAWGVLGGTFDPPHYAHLAIAEEARDALGLAGVLFVPAAIPPHKPGRRLAPARDRVAMVELAIADNAAFRLSRVEVDRPGPSYTADTIDLLLADPPQPWDSSAGLVFVLSVEALLGLETWHAPEQVLRSCRLAVVPRHGFSTEPRSWMADHFPAFEDRLIVLDGPDLGHSASAIRDRVAAGRTIRYLVPPAVEAYIMSRGLYRAAPRHRPQSGRPDAPGRSNRT